LLGFSLKPFFKKVVITPTTLLLEFSLKPILKRLAGKQFFENELIRNSADLGGTTNIIYLKIYYAS